MPLKSKADLEDTLKIKKVVLGREIHRTLRKHKTRAKSLNDLRVDKILEGAVGVQ